MKAFAEDVKANRLPGGSVNSVAGGPLGANCIVGRGVYVGTEVFVGDNCKIQDYALAIIERAKIKRALGRCT